MKMKFNITTSSIILLCLSLPALGLEEEVKKHIEQQAENLKGKLIEIRRDIYMHPELSNREERTSRIIAENLKKLGLEVKTGVAKYGVIGLLKGRRPGMATAVRANMDALPIEDASDVPYKSVNKGVKHACGHDVEIAIQLGVAEILAGMKDKIKGAVKFIFQPAEEGPPEGEEGGAQLMLKEGVLENPKVSAVLALHVLPTLDVGTIGYTPGPTMASSDNFEITIVGRGTHAAYPQSGIDSIVVSGHVIVALQSIVSRNLDAREPTVLSISVIEGGNRSNIIPERVRMEGTVRTLNPEVRRQMPQLMERIIKGIAESYGATYRFDYQFRNPVNINNLELVKAMVPTARRIIGDENVIEQKPQMASEDFAFFSEKVPTFYYFLGVRNESKGIVNMVHTPEFNVDEEAIPIGVKIMASMLLAYQEKPSH